MPQLLKQRLIGALLVLFVIIFVALYLVNNATNNNPDNAPPIEQPEFTTSVESLSVETSDVTEEALVDPHDLEQKPTTAVVQSVPSQITSTAKEAINETAGIIEKKVEAALVEKEKLIEKVAESVKPVATVTPKQAQKVEANTEQWLIQLASFSQKPNAIALQSKVKQLGLTANIEHVGSVYRVQVGPESSRESAEKLAAKLANDLKLKPQVLTLKPNNNG
jgi:cell division septation protein DedD